MTGDRPADASPRLEVRGLQIVLPDGGILVEDLSMEVAAGEVAVLLGGSGSGKSTFARVLFEPGVLEGDGFEVRSAALRYDHGDLGLVPQRGALFDHLDVRGNLDLALRYAERRPGARPETTTGAAADPGAAGETETSEPSRWLERVGLDPALVNADVASLSGGQAQRVAVARVLAGGRQLLFLDEPSVGLDPHRVRMLGRLIREQCERLGVAVVVVTHDVALAVGVADRLYVLDPATRRLERLFAGEWPGPMERPDVSPNTRGHWMVRLEAELVDKIDRGEAARRGRHGKPRRRALAVRRAVSELTRPLAVAAVSLPLGVRQLVTRPGDFATVAWRVARQALTRPLLFYAIVSTLIGYTVLYVISKVGGVGVRPDALVREIGGSYVVALAPALSAILFVAASGSATNAWLGNVTLTKQALAMQALGVDTRAYLWGPAWFVLAASYLAVAALFGIGMVCGGLILCQQYGVTDGWELLTADLLDPRPERVRHVVRAVFLIWLYGWGIASDVVAKGGADKREADAVTRGMTASVVACTLWVVAWELISVLVVFGS